MSDLVVRLDAIRYDTIIIMTERTLFRTIYYWYICRSRPPISKISLSYAAWTNSDTCVGKSKSTLMCHHGQHAHLEHSYLLPSQHRPFNTQHPLPYGLSYHPLKINPRPTVRKSMCHLSAEQESRVLSLRHLPTLHSFHLQAALAGSYSILSASIRPS